MCTLTIIPWKPPQFGQDSTLSDSSRAEGLRVVFNRDESPLRPAALPPHERRFGTSKTLMPVDPVSDGTWIAITDTPLILGLMNVYQTTGAATIPSAFVPLQLEPPATRTLLPKISRGEIIPHVATARTLAAAIELARGLKVEHYEPFRLLLIDRHHLTEVSWSGAELAISEPTSLDAPLFFTSSGLGDELVANPRRRLFKEMFSSSAKWPQAQDAFHRHVWPGSDHTSVWMTRPEARTMSRTIVELGPAAISMRYEARLGASNHVQPSPPVELPLSAH